MAVSINGTTGVTTTGLVASTIQADAGNVSLSTLNVAGNTTVQNLSVGGSSIPIDGGMNFRNRVINGDMRIAQRTTAALEVTGVATYPVDRFFGTSTKNGQLYAQQSTVAPPGFSHSIYIYNNGNPYTILEDSSFKFEHAIEGLNTVDFAFGTASAESLTLSFWIRSNRTGSFGAAVQNSARTRSYPFAYTVSVANTWEKKTITIPGDTTGTWLTDNGVGLRIVFSFGTGSDFVAPADAWVAADDRSPAGTVSLVDNYNDNAYITGVQLEAGSVATPFERRPYGTELVLCQRYAEAGIASNVDPCTDRVLWGVPVFFRTDKRATPTITFTQLSSNIGSGAQMTRFSSISGFVYELTPNATGTGAVQISYLAVSEI